MLNFEKEKTRCAESFTQWEARESSPVLFDLLDKIDP